MQQHYDPSNDEIKVMKNIEKELLNIAKKRFQMKDPCVKFNYNDGLHYERMQQNKDISVTIYNEEKTINMRVMINFGLLIYYQIRGKDKVYVTKLKDIVKYKNTNIKKGHWVSSGFIYCDCEPCDKLDKELGEYVPKEFEKIPDPKYNHKEEKVQDDEEDRYMDFLMRQMYCEEFRETYGTDSIEVTDEFY